jgi:high-affinity iron transporter
VLVVMVGQTARTMQGTGWLPITPIDVDPPYWLGLWFGVYRRGDDRRQVAAMIFVIELYVLAREVRVPVRATCLARPGPASAGAPGQGAAWGSDAGVAVDSNGHPAPRRWRAA